MDKPPVPVVIYFSSEARLLSRGPNPMEEWMSGMDGDRWWSVKEVAEYLGIKRDTLYKWIDRKDIPAHKVGKLWKFRRDEVDAWVRSGGAGDRPNGRKDQTGNS